MLSSHYVIKANLCSHLWISHLELQREIKGIFLSGTKFGDVGIDSEKNSLSFSNFIYFPFYVQKGQRKLTTFLHLTSNNWLSFFTELIYSFAEIAKAVFVTQWYHCCLKHDKFHLVSNCVIRQSACKYVSEAKL